VITPNLYPFYSLLRAYHIWFTPTSSGMHLGHKTRPGHCNMQHCLFISDYWSCMCVCLSYSSLFQSDLLPHLQSLWSIQACALCFWVPLGRTWEHKALGWTGYKLWRWGNTLPCWVYYCEFLEFFQFGENTQWIMDGFAVGRMCVRSVDIDHFCTKAPWV